MKKSAELSSKKESSKVKKIVLPIHVDDRGSLVAAEMKDYVSWPVARFYYVTEVLKPRGGHAVRHEKKIYICQKGHVKAKFHDGEKWIEFDMNGPGDAVLMESMCFREFYDFSGDAVLLAVSSVNYHKEDYIYDFDEFLKEVNS
ncbi:FdtA/QdtA family cupin domain-containing protein [Candidatus Peregrinibacteria bacterium]|nr:FdtA/QdtA family cupin domain-containing protein [Candidatus Peregrinibacteria bacterium]